MLNPYALPAETEARFNLLAAVALALAAVIGFTLTALFTQYGLIDPPVRFSGRLPAQAGDFAAQRAAYLQLALDSLAWLLLPAALVAAVALLAGLLFLLHPAYLRRRNRLIPFNPEQDPPFAAALHDLAGQAGLSPPAIEIERDSRCALGQAFGRPGRYSLRLGGRMRLLLRKAPERFRAIVLHELAHLANRDVPRAYLAIAIWLALFACALLPLLASNGFHLVLRLAQTALGAGDYTARYYLLSVLPRAALLALQAGLLLALMAAILSSVLRAREQYADWRAALWGAGEPLADILQGNVPRSESSLRRWLRWFRLHPSARERLESLRHPDRLFRVSADLPFFAGFLLAFLLGGLAQIGPLLVLGARGLTQIAYLALAERLLPLESSLAGALLGLATSLSLGIPTALGALLFLLGMGYLVAGTLGLQVQRQALAELAGKEECLPVGGQARGGRSAGLLEPALWLAAGVQIGFFATPGSPLAPLHYSLRSFFFLLALAPIWMAFFASLAWLWLAYARLSARWALGTATGEQAARRRRRLLGAALGALLWVMLAPALLGQFLLRDLAEQPSYQTLPWALFPLTLLAALAIFALAALATWSARRFWLPAGGLRCPACGAPARQPYAVGQACGRCGQRLAGWLYVSGAAGEAESTGRRSYGQASPGGPAAIAGK